MSTHEWEDLASRYFDGLATEEEVGELSDQLRNDAAIREEYLGLAAVHSRLAIDAKLWAEVSAASVVPVAAPGRKRGWTLPVAAAAAIALFLVVGPPKSEETAKPREAIATLLKSEAAIWGGTSLAEGSRVNVGVLELRGGEALLRLDGGTELLLRGPANLILETGGRVRLQRGEARALVPEEAAGFILATPGGEIVDLGTEFFAHVDASAATEVSVIEGEVEVRSFAPDAPAPLRLVSGESLSLDRRGVMGTVAAAVSSSAIPTLRERSLPTAPADLLTVERFVYPEGRHDPATLDGGEGWSGPWSLLTDPLGEPLYTGTTRDIEIVAKNGKSGWHSPAGKIFRQRRLAHPLDLSRDGVRYVSLRWFEEEAPARTGEEKPASGLSLTFRSPDASVRERICLRVDHLFRARIETGAGQGFIGRVRPEDGQEVRLVAKILTRHEGDDEISLRFFAEGETLGEWEPESWDLLSRGVRLDVSLDHLVVQSGGPLPRHIMEIGVGTTWRSVVNP